MIYDIRPIYINHGVFQYEIIRLDGYCGTNSNEWSTLIGQTHKHKIMHATAIKILNCFCEGVT